MTSSRTSTDHRVQPDGHEPRLVMTTRRALMVRGALAGVAVAMPLLAACGTNDAEALAGASGQTASVASEVAGDDPASTTTAVTTAVTTASSSESGAVFPGGAELVVDFTYTSGNGRTRNPYIAVWVEDADGNLVDTISLWYKQGKGEKWLADLRSWYAASDAGAEVSISGATRVAGSYTVAWDGTDLDGNPVARGDYNLYIESAREHGPHELTSASFTVGDEAFTLSLDDQGELTGASAELVLA